MSATKADSRGADTGNEAANKEAILKAMKEKEIRFLRLQFTDIMGIIKNVEVPESQFQKALDGEILFDGSSIEGFARIEESDMLLRPDLDTFSVFPARDASVEGKVWEWTIGVENASMIHDLELGADGKMTIITRSADVRASGGG